ncbi:MAG: hypothetical protein ABSD90_06870 [Methylocystis sp.]|jgi:hypothetical protein
MSKQRITKEQAEARLVKIAFEFQEILLAYVHKGDEAGRVSAFYKRGEAEQLADEIQTLHHFFEVP